MKRSTNSLTKRTRRARASSLSNKLTVICLIITPLFLLLMVLPLQSWGAVGFWGATIPMVQLIAAISFIAATIIDNLDGQIARRHHLVTSFGKFTDPLADKLPVMTAFIVLTGNGAAPSWVASIAIWWELSVTGLRSLLVEQDGVALATKMSGKIKITTQLIATIFLLLNNIIFAIWNIPFGQIVLYICLFSTIYSGVDYFIQGCDAFSDGFK